MQQVEHLYAQKTIHRCKFKSFNQADNIVSKTFQIAALRILTYHYIHKGHPI